MLADSEILLVSRDHFLEGLKTWYLSLENAHERKKMVAGTSGTMSRRSIISWNYPVEDSFAIVSVYAVVLNFSC